VKLAGGVLIAWGAWLGALAAMLWLWTSSELAPLLLTGSAVACLCAGLFTLTRSGAGSRRRITDSSVSMLLIAVGISVGLLGMTAGPWLYFLGGEALAFGIAGLVREAWATRRRAAP